MNTYTTLGVLDQAAGVEALPPVPTGELTSSETATPLRPTGTDDQDRATGVVGEVPPMVPRGAQIGAERATLIRLQVARDCTEKGANGKQKGGVK